MREIHEPLDLNSSSSMEDINDLNVPIAIRKGN